MRASRAWKGWRAVRTSYVPTHALRRKGVLRGPEESVNGREDWDLDVIGYGEFLERPIVGGWRVRPDDLEDQSVHLERVEVHLKEIHTFTLDLKPRTRIAKRG